MVVVLALARAASAEEPVSEQGEIEAAPVPASARFSLSGRVLDRVRGGPVEGAVVFVAGASGLEHVLTTDREGRYAVAVRPGTYHVVFSQGPSRTSGKVVVGAAPARLDGQVDSAAGEVIVIEEKLQPPVPPNPTNWSPRRAPPYSDRAVLSNAWTHAWLLLEVSERGEVTRFKFLERPGYDLEPIAAREAFKLRFDPARDREGKPMRSLLVWEIEWPSAWYLVALYGTRTRMPEWVGVPPRRQGRGLPCEGAGPWQLGSVYRGYKKCSRPDLSRATAEPWVVPPART